MASEDSTKVFEVKPSEYVVNYISNSIKNEYVKSQINNALCGFKALGAHKITQTIVEEENEETLCPVCKNKLIFAEGCNICIDCGYSGCTSG